MAFSALGPSLLPARCIGPLLSISDFFSHLFTWEPRTRGGFSYIYWAPENKQSMGNKNLDGSSIFKALPTMHSIFFQKGSGNFAPFGSGFGVEPVLPKDLSSLQIFNFLQLNSLVSLCICCDCFL